MNVLKVELAVVTPDIVKASVGELIEWIFVENKIPSLVTRETTIKISNV